MEVGVRVGTGVSVAVELGEGVGVGLAVGMTVPQADESKNRLMISMRKIGRREW